MTPKRYAQVQEKFTNTATGIVRRPLPARFAYRRFRDRRHQPQSFLYPFHPDGRACCDDFRTGVDLFGEYGANNIDWLMAKCTACNPASLLFWDIGSGVGLVLVEKTPAPPVLTAPN